MGEGKSPREHYGRFLGPQRPDGLSTAKAAQLSAIAQLRGRKALSAIEAAAAEGVLVTTSCTNLDLASDAAATNGH
jgi:hypothetical protein